MKHCSISTITESSCRNQRVILRADLNIPFSGGTINNDFRLQEVRPTIDLLLGQQATVIVVTHLGRPHVNGEPVVSTAIIADWFTKQGYRTHFAATPLAAQELTSQHKNILIVFENIRMFPGEMQHDITFAQELARLGDCYVTDAFGTLHRTDTSISLVPQFFAPEKRFIGLLVTQEIKTLEPLVKSPKKPFVVVIGGGKVRDKIPLIQGLIGKADTILLCPAIAFTFMKAQGVGVGASLVDETLVDTCKEILKTTERTNTRLITPTDLLVAEKSYDGALSTKNVTDLTSTDVGINLGPVSTAAYIKELITAKTIFFNAAIGFVDRPETLTPTYALINRIEKSTAYSVIGGGDSVALAQQLLPKESTTHLSTGGGATLAFLSGEQLPGLKALCSTE